MKILFRLGVLAASAMIGNGLAVSCALAASRADLHVAVFSSGFLVDTQRQVTYGDRSRRIQIKTQAKGTAQGETAEAGIEIDRIDLGTQWNLDPRAKTYSEERYQSSGMESEGRAPATSGEPPTLKITHIEPKVSGPLGSASINGLPCQAYTIRLIANFVNPQTGKPVATETLLEKLWVTEKAPGIERFRKAESAFQDALTAVYGSEKASFRWLLREFNKHILEMNGNPDDFKQLQTAYRTARNSIAGVTVRQLAGWNWRPLDSSAPGSDSPDDMNTFIGSIAAGLGAPPDQEGKSALADSDKPRWVQDLEKDLGRTGPTAMILEEVLKATSANVPADFFEIPNEYRKL